MKTTVNSQPAAWSAEVVALFRERVESKLTDGETISSANYHTPRPYVDEYNRGSDKAGFVYIVQPGNHVCYVNWYAQEGR